MVDVAVPVAAVDIPHETNDFLDGGVQPLKAGRPSRRLVNEAGRIFDTAGFTICLLAVFTDALRYGVADGIVDALGFVRAMIAKAERRSATAFGVGVHFP